MNSKRVLCLALAAVLTSATATARAQTQMTVSGDREESVPITSDEVSGIKFEDGSVLSFDTSTWGPGTSAITIKDGATIAFTTDSGSAGDLIISGATGRAISNYQSVDNGTDAVLDLTQLKSITLTGNTSQAEGGGIYLRSLGAHAIVLKVGDDATISDNKSAQGSAIYAMTGTGALTVSLGHNLLVSGNESNINGLDFGAMHFQSFSTTATDITIGDFAKFHNNSMIGQQGNAGATGGGGAIGLYLSRSGVLTIGNGAEFIGNSSTINEVSGKTTGVSGGGAILATSLSDSVKITVGAGSLFSGNWVEVNGATSGAYVGGGAIYQYGNASELTINGGTRFENNSATNNGGAILLAGRTTNPTLNLDTADGDIVFTGNKHKVSSYTNGQPDEGSGEGNSIYLVSGSNNAEINITGARNIYFDDPVVVDIDSGSSANLNLGSSSAWDPIGFVSCRGITN